MKSYYNKNLDILLTYLFQGPLIITFVIISKKFIPIFYHYYNPEKISVLFTFIFCIIGSFFSSKVARSLIIIPDPYVVFYVIVTNFITFGIISVLLIVFRIPYQRADLILFFCFSLVVQSLSILLYHKKRVFVFYEIQIGSKLNLSLPKSMRVFKIRGLKENGQGFVNATKKRLLNKNIDGIIVDFSAIKGSQWQEIFFELNVNGIKIYDKKTICEIYGGYVEVRELKQISTEWRSNYQFYSIFKRYIDFILAIILLIPFSFVILICSFLITLETSGGPIFKQQRVGFQGRTFDIYKLRTMYAGNEKLKIVNAVESDKRITRIGFYLRKLRLDEFPQIINVLKGDMSWIGPRPETVELTKLYTQKIPYYYYRSLVRPGITGWAAVNQGYVSGVDDTSIKLSFDFYYIKHFSPIIDLVIVWRTICVILLRFGSK